MVLKYQISQISILSASRIWSLVCGISNLCYCLVYILPGVSGHDNDIHYSVSNIYFHCFLHANWVMFCIACRFTITQDPTDIPLTPYQSFDTYYSYSTSLKTYKTEDCRARNWRIWNINCPRIWRRHSIASGLALPRMWDIWGVYSTSSTYSKWR